MICMINDQMSLKQSKSMPHVLDTKKQSNELPTVLAGIETVLTPLTAFVGTWIWNSYKKDKICM